MHIIRIHALGASTPMRLPLLLVLLSPLAAEDNAVARRIAPVVLIAAAYPYLHDQARHP
jgi:hypothetical protein